MRPERLTWGMLSDPDTILRVLTRFESSPSVTVPGAFDRCTSGHDCGFRHLYTGTHRHYCVIPRKYECVHRCLDAWPGPPVRVSGTHGDGPLASDERTRECHRAILHTSIDIAINGTGMAAKAAQVMWRGDDWDGIENEHRAAAQVALATEIAQRITRKRHYEAEARKIAKRLGRTK